MAVVFAAMVFTLGERQRARQACTLTSVRDLVEMVAWYFEAHPTPKRIVETIRTRHHRRKRSMEY